MLTESETRLVAYAVAIRADEQQGVPLWWAPADEAAPDAVLLHARGYFEHSWHNGDMLFRLSDRAMTAQELYKLANPPVSLN